MCNSFGRSRRKNQNVVFFPPKLCLQNPKKVCHHCPAYSYRLYFVMTIVVLPECSLRRTYAGRPSCAWLPVGAGQVAGLRGRCPAAGNTCPVARRTPAVARRSCRTGCRRSGTSSSGRSPGTCRIGLSKTKRLPRSFGFDFAIVTSKQTDSYSYATKHYLALSKFH